MEGAFKVGVEATAVSQNDRKVEHESHWLANKGCDEEVGGARLCSRNQNLIRHKEETTPAAKQRQDIVTCH